MALRDIPQVTRYGFLPKSLRSIDPSQPAISTGWHDVRNGKINKYTTVLDKYSLCSRRLQERTRAPQRKSSRSRCNYDFHDHRVNSKFDDIWIGDNGFIKSKSNSLELITSAIGFGEVPANLNRFPRTDGALPDLVIRTASALHLKDDGRMVGILG